MCFQRFDMYRTQKMETTEHSELIKNMMKRNNFYYEIEKGRGWVNMKKGSPIWYIHYYGWTPIGFTSYKLDMTNKTKKSPTEDPFVWLLYLLVDEPYQNLGFGTNIMNGYKNMTANNNMRMLVIDLDKTKKNFFQLVNYYGSKGFELVNNGKMDMYGQIIMKWNYKAYEYKTECCSEALRGARSVSMNSIK